MSLNWNVSKCRDHEELLVDVPATPTDMGGIRPDAMTNAFIWASMVTGLGKGWTLDADFAPEFYARIKMLEKLNGPMVTRWNDEAKQHEPVLVSYEDVTRRIGLHVNVSPVSRTAFLKNAVAVDLDRDAANFNRHTLAQFHTTEEGAA